MTGPAAWRIAATSVTGSSHAARGEACQDRHRVEVTNDGALIAIVSDGAGSAIHGATGADTLCTAVAAGVKRHLALSVGRTCTRRSVAGLARAVRDGVRDARAMVLDRAQDDAGGIDDYHATLVGAVMLPDRGGLMFHIGDGAALAMTADGSDWTLSAPRNGEFADTTYFFTDARWWASLRFTKIDAGQDTLFVMSDGVTEISFNHQPGGAKPFMGFFRPIATFLAGQDRDTGEAALIATLEKPDVCTRTGDDKTLVFAALARS